MLEELSIRNFAIIDDLKLRFGPGLTILSGETGAGKSIIVNAVNLLLGARASARMIRSGSETAEVEALFRIPPEGFVAGQLAELGLAGPEEGCLLVRRVVARNNRHRIYINDRLATVQAMARLTENLASISGQHAHQKLLKEENHLLILDQFAGLMPLRAEVGELYRRLFPLVERRQKLLEAKQRQAEQLELLKFQQNEIQQAQLQEGEDEHLEQQRARLRNIQALFAGVHRCLEGISTILQWFPGEDHGGGVGRIQVGCCISGPVQLHSIIIIPDEHGNPYGIGQRLIPRIPDADRNIVFLFQILLLRDL